MIIHRPRTPLKAMALLVSAFVLAACGSGQGRTDRPSDSGPSGRESAGPVAGPGADKRPSPKPSGSQGEFASDQLLVRFEESASPAERERIRALHKLEKIDDLPASGLELVRILDGAGPAERAQEVSREALVRYAEPNFISRTQS